MQVQTRTVPVKDLDVMFQTFEEISDAKEALFALIDGLQETEMTQAQKGLVKLVKSYSEVVFNLVDKAMDEFVTVVKPTEDLLSRYPNPDAVERDLI